MLQRRITGIQARFSNGDLVEFDHVIAAAGLCPNNELAVQAELDVGRGIKVDRYLCTSDAYIYALGDVAEIEGRLCPFLQPIALSAAALAKTLCGEPTELLLSLSPINVKTPNFPLQLAGDVQSEALRWQYEDEVDRLLAKAYQGENLVGYIAAGAAQGQGLQLLRQII